jgi:hypothetical protein
VRRENGGGHLYVQLETNVNASLPIALSYDLSPIDESDGTVYAVLVLVGLYVLIIFEVHYILSSCFQIFNYCFKHRLYIALLLLCWPQQCPWLF